MEERQASDARRREIKYLVGGLRGGARDRQKTMETMGKIHQLCQEEGMNGLPDFGALSSFPFLPFSLTSFPLPQAIQASTLPTPFSGHCKLEQKRQRRSLRSEPAN
jgi:hypothetical protein